MKLDFITFITRNSAAYAEYLKYTAQKFLSGKHEINWKCVESMNAERLPKGYKCVDKTGEDPHSSRQAAKALHAGLKHIDNDYILFIDCDIAIVYNDWDDVIINELNNYDCFGGAYAESDDEFNRVRFKKFPACNLFAFRAKVKDKLDFSPFRGDEFKYVPSPKEARILGVRKRKLFTCDGGWKLPLIFHKNNFTHNYMPMYMMEDEERQLPFIDEESKKRCLKKPICMHEWHYNGKLFATHKKHSRGNPIDKGFGLAWRKRVDLYIKRKGL